VTPVLLDPRVPKVTKVHAVETALLGPRACRASVDPTVLQDNVVKTVWMGMMVLKEKRDLRAQRDSQVRLVSAARLENLAMKEIEVQRAQRASQDQMVFLEVMAQLVPSARTALPDQMGPAATPAVMDRRDHADSRARLVLLGPQAKWAIPVFPVVMDFLVALG